MDGFRETLVNKQITLDKCFPLVVKGYTYTYHGHHLILYTLLYCTAFNG